MTYDGANSCGFDTYNTPVVSHRQNHLSDEALSLLIFDDYSEIGTLPCI